MKANLSCRVIAGAGIFLLVLGAWLSHGLRATAKPQGAAPLPRIQSDWLIDTVDDASNAGLCPSLALDSSGSPHISYVYGTTDTSYLEYAHYDHTGWQAEVVDEFYVSCNTSLALDRFGRPHITYGAGWKSSELKYAYYDGTAWHTETVDPASCPLGLSLSLDAAGQPHISYMDCADNCLKYAHHDGSSWQILTIESMPQGVTGNTSLVLDASGHPRIAYCSYDVFYNSCDDLKYAWYDGTAWFSETADSAGLVGGGNDLALDGSGRPHISYEGATCLHYAYREDTGWITMTADCAAWSTGTSLALDAQERPHISYIASAPPYLDSFLEYTWFDGAQWQRESVDPDTNRVWRPTSLALDPLGQPHISYHDIKQGDLKYAHKLSFHHYLPLVGTGAQLTERP